MVEAALTDFDPDVSLRTLRGAIDNYDGRSSEVQQDETTLLAMMIGVFNALDIHLSAGGRLPTEWSKDGRGSAKD